MLAAPSARGPLHIVEVGAGTGIATRLLLRAAGEAGQLARLQAFDPSPGMLSYLRGSLFGTRTRGGFLQALQDHGVLSRRVAVSVGEGSFDTYPAGDDNDLVVIAQAWHWCADFDRALAHIARSLRPGGVLALVWNLEDRDAAPWVAKLRDLYEPYEDDTPQYRHMLWKEMYTTPSFAAHFDTLRAHSMTRVLPATVDAAVHRMLSKSYVSVLDDAAKVRLAQQARAMLDGDDTALGRQWLDKEDGVFAYPYRTGASGLPREEALTFRITSDVHLFRRK
ncbi:hypothetical protein MSPP1_003873 [Malassezia sp. CBS 17886]|nr:hypothetical protein MSPP1_003873 [Malassezia sp. CBS 17886]